MNIHITTGRHRLGLTLSLFSAFLWGTLPIALKHILAQMDAYTITWYRFLASLMIIMLFLRPGSLIDALKSNFKLLLFLLLAASLSLSGNYILFMLGLNHLSPSTVTVLIQTAPIFMLFGSIIVFKENFSWLQWTGFILLCLGLVAFFNDRLGELIYSLSSYTIGVLLILASAALWAVYALAQKQLLAYIPSSSIIFVLYLMGALFFLPVSKPATLLDLDSNGLTLLAYSSVGTILAYGCFAESLDHWEASRVGAVLATTPLFTLLSTAVGSVFFPDHVYPDHFNMLSILGAFLVVGGAMMCALGQTKSPEDRT